MKAVAGRPFSVDSEGLSLESCEEGLDFLAYLIREEIATGRATSRANLDETRAIAAELLAHAARKLSALWGRPRPGVEGLLEPRLVRLMRATRGALHPSATRRELAEALQSAADLIRSTRMLVRGDSPVLPN
jgi:hypothetical protein